MIIAIKLILAHLLGDFLLQPKSWVENKEFQKIRSPKLYQHITIHGIIAMVLLWDLSLWLLAFQIMVLHYGIDLLKLYIQQEPIKSKWFVIDQILHVLSIITLSLIWFSTWDDITPIFLDPANWLNLTAVVFLTVASGIIIQTLLGGWSKQLSDNKDESLANAGKYIGILERLLVFMFIVNEHWEAVGFLLAAKSVFRFGDLKESKDRKLTEYILIGTLLSFGIAILVGMLVLKVSITFVH